MRLLQSLSPRLGGIHHCHQLYYSECIRIGTHHRLLYGNLGVQNLDTWNFSLSYGHHYSGQEPNLKFTGYGPLENLETWIEVCPYGHYLSLLNYFGSSTLEHAHWWRYLLDILVFCPDFSDSDTKIIPPVGHD